MNPAIRIAGFKGCINQEEEIDTEGDFALYMRTVRDFSSPFTSLISQSVHPPGTAAPMPFGTGTLQLKCCLASLAALDRLRRGRGGAAQRSRRPMLTTCFEAFWNWSNAAVVAAIVDLNALIAASEPAGADLLALSTHDATALRVHARTLLRREP